MIPRAISLIHEVWSAYSSPIPKNKQQLLLLTSVCSILALSNGLLLNVWLLSLSYDVLLATILSIVVSTIMFCTLVLIHPLRCLLTMVMPMVCTKQGRRLLLTACFMLIAFNIIPNILVNIRTVLQVITCLSQHSSESVLNSTNYFQSITQDVNSLVRNIKDKISLTSTTGDYNIFSNVDTSLAMNHLLKMSENIKEDLAAAESFFKNGILISSRILAGIFIFSLLSNAAWYLKNYLTDLKFDNLYITKRFEMIAQERNASHLLTSSSSGLIKPTGLKLSRKEICGCVFQLLIPIVFVILIALMIALDHVAHQFAKEVGNWAIKIPTVQVAFQIKYHVSVNYNYMISYSIMTREGPKLDSESSTGILTLRISDFFRLSVTIKF
ncbi:hypothetical protein GDO86_014561 [Hymenochirus boettgeri]|uniref:Dendritic cell-specific transmembrane protein-like domain-containing protein n=1 Tax=Hymenochirus boettgeri TaxID=247094 RepID=A0A8T2JV31_9PIPI|nr:hypothetical protein GDO86_014561 [Hymenochirus boettgeri]